MNRVYNPKLGSFANKQGFRSPIKTHTSKVENSVQGCFVSITKR